MVVQLHRRVLIIFNVRHMLFKIWSLLYNIKVVRASNADFGQSARAASAFCSYNLVYFN